MSVTATIKLPVNFIVSDPVKPYNDMGVTSRTLNVRKVTLSNPNATLGANVPYNLLPLGSDLIAELTNLEIATHYEVEAAITNQNGTTRSKKFFINTADASKRWILEQKITWMNSPVANVEVRLRNQFLLYDRWLQGLRTNDTFLPIAEPVTDADRYSSITVKQTGGYIVRTTNQNGNFHFNNLKQGTYTLEYFNGTHWILLNGALTINANITVGEYDTEGL